MPDRRPDFSDDILDYLRRHRGKLVPTLKMVQELTCRIPNRKSKYLAVRGQILSDITRLIKDKKVIRYRKVTMVKQRPRSSQGLLRISEIYV